MDISLCKIFLEDLGYVRLLCLRTEYHQITFMRDFENHAYDGLGARPLTFVMVHLSGRIVADWGVQLSCSMV